MHKKSLTIKIFRPLYIILIVLASALFLSYAQQSAERNTSGSEKDFKPITSQITFHPLGFVFSGPIIQAQFKVAKNTIVGPHIRFAGMGVFYRARVSTKADEVSASSMAIGIELKQFFPETQFPDLYDRHLTWYRSGRFYYCGVIEYGWGSYKGAVGYKDQWEGEHVYTDLLLGGGYSMRFDSWFINFGLYLGMTIDTERQWWYTANSDTKFQDSKNSGVAWLVDIAFGFPF
jgi:hypothetical protein